MSSRVSKNTPGASSQPQKLKDSCDKCSAAKVRCTKEKPSCSRCDKLGNACSYSPARRVGRPYRPKESLFEEKETGPAQPATKSVTTHFVHESIKLYSQSNLTAVDTGLSSTGSETIFHAHPTPPESAFDMGQIQQVEPHTTKHSQIDQDCLMVALDLSAELEGPAEELRRASPVCPSLVTATTQMMAQVLCRLSAILYCPCSERAEVGMLVSAICMCVMDMHAMIMASFVEKVPSPAAFNQDTHWGALSDEPGRLNGDEGRMRVMGELLKVAQFIAQLTERYNGSNALDESRSEESSDLPVNCLPSIAFSLQQSLQQITHQTSKWSSTHI
ncbi:unnamed protein product [Penicillium olsonii]|uniref:Zn(2)-C6 fungal-type domain-containing protein n=1 Tax=Penicillium olsonii TaxID=99116 RepID=A0A9W4MJY8_PENOL|nr:unnamed protein product [Penicillium olsonii]CAG8185798.1 unnamed protein product [Penicillium olsonii]